MIWTVRMGWGAGSPRRWRRRVWRAVPGCWVLLAVLAVAVGAQSAHGEATAMVFPGEYIVSRNAPPVSQSNGVTLQRTTRSADPTFEKVVVGGISLQSARSASAAPQTAPLNWATVTRDCERIKKQDPSVTGCEPNSLYKLQPLPNDELFPLQWGLLDPTSARADIGAALAWDKGTGSATTLVGVIDSGIHLTHPDLAANIWKNPNEPLDGLDNDRNGYVDDRSGINTAFRSGDPSDCNGHGTHVSGIIGAVGNNSIGVTGVAWSVGLIVASTDRDCGDGTSLEAILAAYNYFIGLKRAGHNIRLINASFAGQVGSAAEFDMIKRLGALDVVVVAAAGNDNTSLDRSPIFPASYDLPNIISVGALGPTRQRAPYSNFGATVDVGAPGGDTRVLGGGIVSTWSPRAAGGFLYSEEQGTSMAAPMVTGALALLASQRPYLTGTHLKDILLRSATQLASLNAVFSGGRVLNVAAMSVAADPPDRCPADPNKIDPGVCGCGKEDRYADTDGDTVLDCTDGCPNDASKSVPGVCGCGQPDLDGDGDGVPNCNDGCPVDPLKKAPGVCGCGVPDTSLDGSAVASCDDRCPADPAKSVPGVCGCGVPDIDSDGDGAFDCEDRCPTDRVKRLPGACGCGVPDGDADFDGIADCNDGCPNNRFKRVAGLCGCGGLDNDSDGDGAPDCVDGCGSDPGKRDPGVCGCGVPDTDVDGNGTVDCRGAGRVQAPPPAPRVAARKLAVQISMTPLAGARYFIEVRITPRAKKGTKPRVQVRTVTVGQPSAVVNKLPLGASVTVRYRYLFEGQAQANAEFSPARAFKVRG